MHQTALFETIVGMRRWASLGMAPIAIGGMRCFKIHFEADSFPDVGHLHRLKKLGLPNMYIANFPVGEIHVARNIETVELFQDRFRAGPRAIDATGSTTFAVRSDPGVNECSDLLFGQHKHEGNGFSSDWMRTQRVTQIVTWFSDKTIRDFYLFEFHGCLQQGKGNFAGQ